LEEPVLDVPFLVAVEPLFEEASGVVAIDGVVGVVSPVVAEPLAVGLEPTVITCAGGGVCGEAPFPRPIRTPTPMAIKSTPTPAITVSAFPRGPLGSGCSTGGREGVAAGSTLGALAGPAARKLLLGALRWPHSRQ